MIQKTLERRKIGDLSVFVRPDSVDEVVLTSAYQAPRFFPPSYTPHEMHTILDVGAHIGIFTIIAARQVPRGRVYAIEPDEENFSILQKNVTGNGLLNVCLRRFAIAEASGDVTLRRSRENWAHSIALDSTGVRCQYDRSVEAHSMDDFLATENLCRVDYMKMNVEGAEYGVLLNTSPAAIRTIGCMLVEYHAVENHNGKDLADWLRSCGFAVKIVPDTNEPEKGWIVACHDRQSMEK